MKKINTNLQKSAKSVSSAFHYALLTIILLSITTTNAQGKFFGGNGSGYATNNINAICTGTAKTWNGTDWFPIGNPNLTHPVVIDGNYDTSINGNIDKCVSEITENGLLEIRASNYINIQNHIINEGIIDIFTEGSVVQINDNAINTGNGIYNTQISTTELLDENRFTYFSSPSTSETLNVFSSWANTNQMWQFNNSTQFWESANTSTTMDQGKGFAIKGDTNASYPITPITHFNGTFNNGIVSQTLQMNVDQQEPEANGDDSNLLGNPFPSAINADLFLTTNPTINALYFWTHASALPTNGDSLPISDYAVWTLGTGTLGKTVNIASGQGFFVTANAISTAIFNNAMRVTIGNDDFKSSENVDKVWLNLTNSENESFNQIALVFREEGTNDFDHQYDALTFSNNSSNSFCSLGNNEEQYVIQTKGQLNSNQEIIPLGFQTNENTNFNISIDHKEAFNETSILLKDNVLNTITNLLEGNYSFNNTENGFINNRFELILNRNSLETTNQQLFNNELIVVNKNKENIFIKTRNNSIISTIKIVDVLGKTVFLKNVNDTEITVFRNKNSEILFVKVQLENGQFLFKKFLKY